MGKDGFDYFENAAVGKKKISDLPKFQYPLPDDDFQFPDQEETKTPF
jgi:hypothetical protein